MDLKRLQRCFVGDRKVLSRCSAVHGFAIGCLTYFLVGHFPVVSSSRFLSLQATAFFKRGSYQAPSLTVDQSPRVELFDLTTTRFVINPERLNLKRLTKFNFRDRDLM